MKRLLILAAMCLSMGAFANFTADFSFGGEYNNITGDYYLYIKNTSLNDSVSSAAIYKIGIGTSLDGEGGAGELGGQMTPVNFLNTPAEMNAAYLQTSVNPNHAGPPVAGGKVMYEYFNGPGNEWWCWDSDVYNGANGYTQSNDLVLVGDTARLSVRERYNAPFLTFFPAVFSVSVAYGCDFDVTNNIYYEYRTLTKTFNRDEVFTIVPEPTSVAVIGVGLIGLVARRRRK